MNQIGGIYDENGTITRTIENNTIIITYNKNNKGKANFTSIRDEVKEKTNLTSIQLINIVDFINNYRYKLYWAIQIIKSGVYFDLSILQRITTIICDNNKLSDVDNHIFDYIGELIQLFPNVSILSFKNCKLNKKSAIDLKKVLMKLPKTIPITEINLENNKDLTPEIIEFIKNAKPTITITTTTSDKGSFLLYSDEFEVG